MAALRRSLLSAVAVGALAASLLTPLAAQAAPAQSPVATPVDVPVIQSDPLKVTTPSEPQGDEPEPHQTQYAQPADPVKVADSDASAFDTASATVSSMDEYSTTYVDKNGAHRTEVSPTPVHVRSNGAWVDASDGGGVHERGRDRRLGGGGCGDGCAECVR